MLKVMRKILKSNGISGLYNGLYPTLIRTIPSTAALYVTYEYSKELMSNQTNKIFA